MRTLIVRNGVVVPGYEDHFNKMIEQEVIDLKKAREEIMTEYEDINLPDYSAARWIEEGKDSLISASYRFGDGNIYIDP